MVNQNMIFYFKLIFFMSIIFSDFIGLMARDSSWSFGKGDLACHKREVAFWNSNLTLTILHLV